MTPFMTLWTRPDPRFLAGWLARVALGACFFAMGLQKALNPPEFLKALHQYAAVGKVFNTTWIAALLPWFEVYCGLLLLIGRWVRGTALIVAGLLAVFSLLVLHRALQLHQSTGIPFARIRFDCGCGGGEVLVWRKLLENSVLMAVSVFLVLRSRLVR